MNKPQISITVPALDEEQHIKALLESFERQTQHNFEVIIVDNGSTDATVNIITNAIDTVSYNLILLHEPRKGVGYARRRGMDDAVQRGVQYLAGTDADSVVPPEWIQSILDTFETTQADCLFGTAAPDWHMLQSYRELHKIFYEVMTLRQSLTFVVEIPPRGVNFAITSQMYTQIGGMPQPVDEAGVPQPGEDVALKDAVIAVGGNIASIPSVVITSQRRVLQAILQGTPNDYYAQTANERDDEDALLQAVQALGNQVLEEFAESTKQRLFTEYIVHSYDTPRWQRAQRFLVPQQDAFAKDIQTLTKPELFDKYKTLFLENAQRIYNQHYDK